MERDDLDDSFAFESSNSPERGLRSTTPSPTKLKEAEFKPKLKIFDEEEASCITHNILNGLLHIHTKNFIHRDMKPENILVDVCKDEDGNVPKNPKDRYVAKIADFGLSAEVHSNVF